MPESSICLTFDFDAISLWMSRGMTSPGAVSRGEFGAHVIPRILKLLKQHDITSTFFIPGHTIETYPDQCKAIVDAGHEIALHGYAHEAVTKLGPGDEWAITERSMQIMDRVLGVVPLGIRTPAWEFTPETVGVIQRAGLEYDSSLMGTDYTPYYVRAGDRMVDDGPYEFGEPTDIVELPVSWSLDDYPHMEYLRGETFVIPGLRRTDDVFANFLDDVDYMVTEEPGGVCVITFHPQVIGRGHRMMGLDRFITDCKQRDVRFQTCLEAARDFSGKG